MGTLNSMTGYGALAGAGPAHRWDWEARSVNGKGLDVRLRLADGCEALEPDVRAAAAKRFTRGNVTISLKVRPLSAVGGGGLDAGALEAVLGMVADVQAAAAARAVALREASAAEILAVPGVLGTDEGADVPMAQIKAGLAGLLDGLAAMRAAEGAKLGEIIGGQLGAVGEMIGAARTTSEARAARSGALLTARVAALMEAQDHAGDPGRLAQELAVLAVKADVTEELDRLEAHVAAARELLAAGGPVGRKLDFLMQEFMREANTLCSKSGAADLTQIGLDLKVLIDQMREQVQNLE